MSEVRAEADEAAAIDRVRAGDTAAYAGLVAAHAGAATRLARLSGAGSDADDVVQEAFVNAFVALGSFRPGSAFRPWLMRIVVNETRNRHRSQQRRMQRDARASRLTERTALAPDPAEQAELTERQRRLHRAVASLPEHYREVVTCRYLMELTEAETSVALELPAGTVKSRAHRALQLLRKELGDD